MSKTLVVSLKVSMANEFVSYFKCHIAHWNVVGINFPQLHKFFGDLYEDLYDDVDVIAEHIRTLDEYAPSSLTEILKLSTIKDNISGKDTDLLNELLESLEETLEAFNISLQLSQENKKEGISNYLAGRIETLEKHIWMLKSTSNLSTK